MDLRPWNYWKRRKESRIPGPMRSSRQLERVIAKNPNHPGACHYYIHAVEAVDPQAAVPCAERLAQLMPGVGHMVHMPAHIYIRVGRYGEAAKATFTRSTRTRRTSRASSRRGILARLLPAQHSLPRLRLDHGGQERAGHRSRRTLRAKVNLDVASRWDAPGDGAYHDLTLTTFGRWDDVLAEPLPPAEIRFPPPWPTTRAASPTPRSGNWPRRQVELDTVMAIVPPLPTTPRQRRRSRLRCTL